MDHLHEPDNEARQREKRTIEIRLVESKAEISDIELETIKTRLNALKVAVERGRSVFTVMTVASAAILFTIVYDPKMAAVRLIYILPALYYPLNIFTELSVWFE